MAQLAVIVMCRSGRASPLPVGCLTSSATKRGATQKATYVPRHISCQFLKTLVVKSLAEIAGGCYQRRNGHAAIFMVVDCKGGTQAAHYELR
jgi:hypothetical protein